MKFYSKFYLVESGEIRARCDEFRVSVINAHKAIKEYGNSIGANGYRIGFGGQLSSVQFPDGITVPDGFKKPTKDGCCYPKKRSKHAEVFAGFKIPDEVEWMEDYLGCPLSLSYSGNGKRGKVNGSSLIGNVLDPIGIYWYSADCDPLLMVPDIEHYANVLREDNESIVFEDNADQWRMSAPGCREIIKEEWDFLVAKNKQARQQCEK